MTRFEEIRKRMEHEKQSLGFDFDITSDDVYSAMERIDNCCDEYYSEYDAIIDSLIGIQDFLDGHPS